MNASITFASIPILIICRIILGIFFNIEEYSKESNNDKETFLWVGIFFIFFASLITNLVIYHDINSLSLFLKYCISITFIVLQIIFWIFAKISANKITFKWNFDDILQFSFDKENYF